MRIKIRKDNVNEDDEVLLWKFLYVVYLYDVFYCVLVLFIIGIYCVDLLFWVVGVL